MTIQTVSVIGCGAVGLYFGTRLKRGGLDVRFLLRSDYDVVKQRGVVVHSVEGDYRETVQAFNRPEDVRGADLVLVCLKSTANDYMIDVLPRILGPESLVLLLQNGLGNEEVAARVVDARRVLGGVAFVCLNRTAPGEVSHTAFGYIKADCFSPESDPEMLERVRQAFLRSGLRFHRAESLSYLKWEKLVWNVPFNGLSASLGGVDTLSILQHPPARQLAREIMEEVIEAARTQGIELDPALVSENIEKTLPMGPYRTSMCLDRLAGRPLEAETIVGEPLRRAERKGLSLPRMRALYAHLSFYNRTVGFAGESESRMHLSEETDS